LISGIVAFPLFTAAAVVVVLRRRQQAFAA
jgi:hypothetical protein